MNTARRQITAVFTLTIALSGISAAIEPEKSLGQQHRWALEFRTELSQPGREQPVEITLAGDWISTIVAVRKGEYDSALELRNPQFTGKGIGSATTRGIEELETRLARRFWVTYRKDGALVAIHFYRDVDPTDRNLLQMIATETQIVCPTSSRIVWNVLEQDGAGSYLAVYNWLDSVTLIKRKLKYVRMDRDPGIPSDGLRVEVNRSELRLVFDQNREIQRLDGTDSSRIGVSLGNSGELATTTTIHLANLRNGHALDLVGSLDRARLDIVTSPIETHKADQEMIRAQLDEQLLSGRTTASLLKAATANESEDQNLSERIAALFRHRPQAVAEALAILKKRGPQRRLTNGLGAAHSKAAIAALSSLAQDETLSTAARVEALSALVFTQSPSVEAMRIPALLRDDANIQIAFAARLMAGAMAHAGRLQHAHEADDIDAELIGSYQRAREMPEITNLLDAFGNSAGPRVVPIIERAIKDPRALVRAAAARALRLAQSADTDDLLSDAIAKDQDPSVRAAAIFAVSFRRPSPPLGEALMRAAKEDPVEYVRGSAVAELRHNLKSFPEVENTLTWVAEHDTKQGIRRLAHDALTATHQ